MERLERWEEDELPEMEVWVSTARPVLLRDGFLRWSMKPEGICGLLDKDDAEGGETGPSSNAPGGKSLMVDTDDCLSLIPSPALPKDISPHSSGLPGWDPPDPVELLSDSSECPGAVHFASGDDAVGSVFTNFLT